MKDINNGFCNQDLFETFDLKPNVKSTVVIPVKNEENYIHQTLTAFLRQLDATDAPIDYDSFEILVLANNCTDRSVSLIKNFQLQHSSLNLYLREVTLPAHQANIGYVRRTLMNAAHARLLRNSGGIILTTDADTVVSSKWITQIKLEFEAGVDAVAGRIVFNVEEQKLLDAHTLKLYIIDEKYNLLSAELEGLIMQLPHDPLPRHHQHFNGSFAVTTDCYAKSGGVPNVQNLEDCAFFEKLQRIDAKVRHSNKVIVSTSARYIGRTQIGLSYQLNSWKNLEVSDEKFLVESCTSILNRLELKKNLMSLWKTGKFLDTDINLELNKISSELKIQDNLDHSLRRSMYFGEWYAQIIGQIEITWRECYPLVPIDYAVLELGTTVKNYSS